MDQTKYIVFFDLDKTITGINSGYALVKAAHAKRVIGIPGILKAIGWSILYKLRLLPAGSIINVMGSWLCGMKQDILSSIAKEATETYLLDSIYTEVYEEIKIHKSNGASMAILSSALSEICHPVAIHLGIGNIICTEMETRNEELTGSPAGNYCYGPEKSRRIDEFCNLNGFDKASAWYYADSLSDLAALEMIGNPVCINPDRALRKIAIAKKWQIKSWKIVTTKK